MEATGANTVSIATAILAGWRKVGDGCAPTINEARAYGIGASLALDAADEPGEVEAYVAWVLGNQSGRKTAQITADAVMVEWMRQGVTA